MTFLSPILLGLAAAAAVPVLMHLMRRRLGRRVEFPAARYLARAERDHGRSLRLRSLLLMVLRVAIVLALAAAAARPIARLGPGHTPTAVALVLDNSLSTSAVVGGRTVLDRLKSGSRDMAGLATREDRLWLVTADGHVASGGVEAVRSAIDSVRPFAGAGDIAAAAAHGAALVTGSGLASRVVAIATDGQATAWVTPLSLGEVRALAYIPPVAAPANRAVIRAEARPARWTPRGAVEARILSADSVPYRVTLNRRTVARGTAGPDERIVVRLAPEERGWVAGSVELAPDELRGDDTRWFAAWIGPAPAVAASPHAGTFVANAVEALRLAGRVAATGAHVAVGPADEVAGLPALLLPPRDPVRLGAANRALERLGIPWRFADAQTGESALRGARLDGETVSLRYRLDPVAAPDAAPSDTLATVGGAPWAVAAEGYVVVASPMDPAATSLPTRAAFVPWLGELLAQRFAGHGGGVVDAAPGARVARPPWADGLEVSGATRSLDRRSVDAPTQPGVYFLTHGGRRVGALVVNPEPEESRLERLPNGELARRLRARDTRVEPEARIWREDVFSCRDGRPIGGAALATALLLLAVEGAIGAGRTRGST